MHSALIHSIVDMKKRILVVYSKHIDFRLIKSFEIFAVDHEEFD